jgi:uncharacterized membrane protein (UPF0136 family)
MKLGQVVLLVYGLVIAAGGAWGYVSAGSTPSLAAGLVCGALVIASYFLSRSHLARGYKAGTGVAVVLCFLFAWRWSKSGAFMPSGMMLALSVVAVVLMGIALRRGVPRGT